LEEIYELGIEEAFSGNHVCLIEWPEIISNILPKNTISIKISLNSDNTRLVSIYKI
jgi:tRNA threonylcarbamoyladenosine biosynthesis protein TsaE